MSRRLLINEDVSMNFVTYMYMYYASQSPIVCKGLYAPIIIILYAWKSINKS